MKYQNFFMDNAEIRECGAKDGTGAKAFARRENPALKKQKPAGNPRRDIDFSPSLKARLPGSLPDSGKTALHAFLFRQFGQRPWNSTSLESMRTPYFRSA